MILVQGSLLLQDNFQHILRIQNTNVEGKRKVMYALTAIKGCGRRFSNLVCKKADIDLNKRYISFYLLFIPQFFFSFTIAQDICIILFTPFFFCL